MMNVPMDRRLVSIALMIASATFAVAATRATLLEPLPAAAAPFVNKLPDGTPRSVRAKAEIQAPSDAFLLAQEPVVDVAPQASPQPIPDPVRLTGTIALPSGGVAVVESEQGSRIMRVGDSWSGLRLREVVTGQAEFVDASTGEPVTLRIRKAGS